MEGILIVVAIILALLLFLFFAIIYPILAMVHASRNPNISGNTRALWIILIFLFWLFAAVIYMAKYKYNFSLIYVGIIVVLICAIGLKSLSYGKNEMAKKMHSELSSIRLEKIGKGIGEKDLSLISRGLSELHLELKSANLWELDEISKLLSFHDLYLTFCKDQIFDQAEADLWMKTFDRRHSITRDELTLIVREQKTK